MAYKLHYKIKRTRNEGTEEALNIVEYFQPASVDATDADYDKQMAFAKAEAYNGEVTVEEVEEELSSTDYKIIKCSEAQLVGEELPYDITALHAERQAIRDQINELEGSES